jgi:hypothetical protein
VLEREGPDEETLAAAEEADDVDEEADDEDLGGAADIDGWDVEGAWWQQACAELISVCNNNNHHSL